MEHAGYQPDGDAKAGGLPLIALTMGDPAGIGAEITLRALSDPETATACQVVVVGDAGVMADAERFTRSGLTPVAIASLNEAVVQPGAVNVLDMHNVDLARLAYGKVSPEAGTAAFTYVRTAVELAMAGKVDAVVTAPIHKQALNLAGFRYSGHTEILADLTGTRDYAMMLADGAFRVSHVTTHVSLRQACELVTRSRVLNVILLTHDMLKSLGVVEPRIGVAGLNPHAGEGGLFGTEESEEIAPAVRDARRQGVDAGGPLPADSLFAKARSGQYDAAVAMYHDQGHIAVKTSGFRVDAPTGRWLSVSGVNVTLGLPIIRTSVDHGTAFDRAGKGTANPESMIQAIRLAAQLARASRGRRPGVPRHYGRAPDGW